MDGPLWQLRMTLQKLVSRRQGSSEIFTSREIFCILEHFHANDKTDFSN